MSEYMMDEMRRFNYLTSEINGVYHEIAAKMGLSDSEMTVLYSICTFGDACGISDICRLSGISKQTVNSALRKLEAEDKIYLEACGKKKNVHLTEKGRAAAEMTVGRLIKAENDIFSSWSKEDVAAYLQLTMRYLEAVRKKAKEI